MSIFLLITGLLLMVGGGYLIVRNLNLYREGLVMKASILDVRKEQKTVKDSDGFPVIKNYFYPVVEYDYEDKDYVKELEVVVSDPNKYIRGGEVDIVFKADNPQEVKATGIFTLYIVPIIISVLGSILFIAGLLV